MNIITRENAIATLRENGIIDTTDFFKWNGDKSHYRIITLLSWIKP